MAPHPDGYSPLRRAARSRHLPIVTFDTVARRAGRRAFRAECTCGEWATHAPSLTSAAYLHHGHAAGDRSIARRNGLAA
jgi:hypothetical protein